ncbi:MAG TPA: exosortase-associated EpsI family protein [Pirellulales bacterium]|nr:exosortase-associated EpsI family protein [Pirellulales bacterium]
MKTYLAPACAALLIISTGLVRAYWGGAFGAGNDKEILQLFADRLTKVPMKVGDWEGVEQEEMDPREREVAEADASLGRSYTNRLSSKVVNVSLVSGRFRGVAQHVPTQCYVAAGYQMMNPEIQYDIETDVGPVKCYTTVFKKDEHTGTTYLRVFWTWSYDGKWIAPDLPRVALVGQPALYKMYFIEVIPMPGQPIEQTASVDFVRTFIPEANAVLFPDQSNSASEPSPTDESAAAPAAG